ncbi:hypothetical protein predicted by Glimmer/Critica [Sorangium cellulosum So ce56]|uniref:Uncharacterized protein n=1 Tax=Sorangium cellulosum (strain So ce56) TaxID=448385 RepID=A9FD86_SORC5|nr:hypothetical protein [Sorangium cellulosum]CAN91737.1 hypothetical protein predicted by Glimmer/Critica [Sorangium cellulosum So ce56]
MADTSDMRRGATPPGALRNPKIDAAIERAVQLGDPAELLALLDRSSGLPARRGGVRAPGPDLGPNAPLPRVNLDLARAVGAAIADRGAPAERLVRALCATAEEYALIVAAQALASLAVQGAARAGGAGQAPRAGGGRRGKGGLDPLEALEELAEDPRRVVRDGVVAALRAVIAARGDAVVGELSSWTDGYLQAYVALEALAERTLLARLSAGAEVVERLEEAFVLSDRSPRADERLQGLRLLRQGMPAQIAALAGRFPEVVRWLEEKTQAERPESRDVVADAIAALRKTSFSDAEVDRLSAALGATAPIPRYAARIVQGTRKRSKGRR